MASLPTLSFASFLSLPPFLRDLHPAHEISAAGLRLPETAPMSEGAKAGRMAAKIGLGLPGARAPPPPRARPAAPPSSLPSLCRAGCLGVVRVVGPALLLARILVPLRTRKGAFRCAVGAARHPKP